MGTTGAKPPNDDLVLALAIGICVGEPLPATNRHLGDDRVAPQRPLSR